MHRCEATTKNKKRCKKKMRDSSTQFCHIHKKSQPCNLCPICLDALIDNENVLKTLLCKHQFHAKCIRQWVRRSRTCPMCRTNIPSLRLKKKNLDPPYNPPRGNDRYETLVRNWRRLRSNTRSSIMFPFQY